MTDQNNAAQTPCRAEAESMAYIAVVEYVNACSPTNRSQVADYLINLASASAVVMAQAEGSEKAAQCLEDAAEWIRKNMPAQPARLETVQ